MNLQQRAELQATIQQWIENFMQNNQILASDMEDALNKAMIKLKDQVILEMLIEQAQLMQQHQQQAAEPQPEISFNEEAPIEEEE